MFPRANTGHEQSARRMLARSSAPGRGPAGRAPGLALAAFLILAPHTVRPARACLHDRAPVRARPGRQPVACADGRQAQWRKGAAMVAAPPPWVGAGGWGCPAYTRVQLQHRLRESRPGAGLPARRLRVGSASLLHVRCLNRLLIDPWEVRNDGPDKLAIVLPADDGRVKVCQGPARAPACPPRAALLGRTPHEPRCARPAADGLRGPAFRPAANPGGST